MHISVNLIAKGDTKWHREIADVNGEVDIVGLKSRNQGLTKPSHPGKGLAMTIIDDKYSALFAV